MVEFGLKLEDNKVDEWSAQYIDYEKLKAILKRAKVGAQRRDELLLRTPRAVTSNVVQERKDRLRFGDDLSDDGSASPPPAAGSWKGDAGAKSIFVYPNPNGKEKGDRPLADKRCKSSSSLRRLSLPTPDVATDASPLLGVDRPIQKVRSNDDMKWNNIRRTMSHVSFYLGLNDDRQTLLMALDDADNKLDMFRQSYELEVTKVKDFYELKSDEISQRMDHLVESAETSGLTIKKPNHRRKGSLVNSLAQRFDSMLHPAHPLREDSPGRERDLSALLDAENPGRTLEEPEKRKKKDECVRNADSIKRAITDIYRTAKLLHNFCIMNYTGFVKIAKKFDKTFPDHKGMFKKNNCDDGKQAEVLAAKMEKIYSKWFCDGDIREAQAQMLTKKGDGLLTDWSQLRLGYRLGMCTVLATWVAWDCVWGQVAKGEVSIGGRTAFPVFRAVFGLLTWHWFWGMAVYVWTRYRINYIYLFEFDPRNVDTPIDIFNDAVDESLVFLICMLLYYKSDTGNMPLWIPPRAYPSILILYTIKRLIFPWKRRLPMWIAIKQVLLAPFVAPTFFQSFVGDVFTSMVKMFQDVLWTVCFVASGDFLLSQLDEEADNKFHGWTEQFWYKNIAIPLVCLMPLWIRFNQCLRRYMDTGKRMPHLANAFKYALSQSVTLFGAFHPLYLMRKNNESAQSASLGDHDDDEIEGAIFIGNYRSNLFQLFWMGLFVASSLYSFFWDIYMDWGLGRRKYGFLGPRLMFPKKSHYYMVICADFVMRFMWVLTLLPPQSGAQFELPAYLSAISNTVELFRRTIWSFFRLEHEHRQNTEGFRRVSVVPLHFNTNHKHKYNHTARIGWKVLIEIVIVTCVVATIGAFSAIIAQKSAHIEL